MNKAFRAALRLLALFVFVFTGAAQAANYTLWVNGRSNNATPGNHQDFRYWGPASTAAGVNKVSVNWDGYNRISAQSYRLRDALDCYCTGTNWCYVAAHSAGNLLVGYTLDLYGSSARYRKNPSPNSAGQCTNSNGSTQTGWNIKWVRIGGGAGGGSELANAGDWALSEPLVSDLKTSTARGMYNHNNTRGLTFSMYAGAKGTLYSGVLPGQDDEAIAYHSSGGVSGSGGGSYCNPSDWLCNDLTLGSGAAQGGQAKWSNHSVVFRDDNESFNHYTAGNWGGIISRVRADVQTNAR